MGCDGPSEYAREAREAQDCRQFTLHSENVGMVAAYISVNGAVDRVETICWRKNERTRKNHDGGGQRIPVRGLLRLPVRPAIRRGDRRGPGDCTKGNGPPAAGYRPARHRIAGRKRHGPARRARIPRVAAAGDRDDGPRHLRHGRRVHPPRRSWTWRSRISSKASASPISP